ncbi:MAG: carbohydrate ABC transporter permease [Methanomassiliicoccales archaeon]
MTTSNQIRQQMHRFASNIRTKMERETENVPAVYRVGKLRGAILQLVMVLLAIIYFIPFYWMILKSFRSSIFAGFPVDLNPFSKTSLSNFLSNFTTVWSFGDFPMWYVNSVFVAVVVVAASVFIGALAGYAFARLKFPGQNILFYVVIATLMIPFPVITISEYVFMVDIGWVNSYQGLILPQIASAVNVFLMRQYFLTIPKDIEDAAKIDGLHPSQIFFKISAPLAKPAFAASAIFTFISSWNNFIWPLFEIQSTSMYTLPLALNFFKGANGTQIYWNQMMLATTITLIPTFIIYIVFERFFVQGISLTGTKG